MQSLELLGLVFDTGLGLTPLMGHLSRVMGYLLGWWASHCWSVAWDRKTLILCSLWQRERACPTNASWSVPVLLFLLLKKSLSFYLWVCTDACLCYKGMHTNLHLYFLWELSTYCMSNKIIGSISLLDQQQKNFFMTADSKKHANLIH